MTLTPAQIAAIFAPILPAEIDAAALEIERHDAELQHRSPQERARYAGLRDSLSNSPLWRHALDALDGSPVGNLWMQSVEDWIATEWPEYEKTVVGDECAAKVGDIYAAGGNRAEAVHWWLTALRIMQRRDYALIPTIVRLKRVAIADPLRLALRGAE